jgi:hypothetical protein
MTEKRKTSGANSVAKSKCEFCVNVATCKNAPVPCADFCRPVGSMDALSFPYPLTIERRDKASKRSFVRNDILKWGGGNGR